MNVSKYACELMRLVGKNRMLKPVDIPRGDKLDTIALIRLLRDTPAPYPNF